MRAGAATAGALARRDGELRDLVDAAADTLATVARSGDDVRAARSCGCPARCVPDAPRSSGLDHSLTGVDALVADIAPGRARAAARGGAAAPRGGCARATSRRDLGATLRTRAARGGPGIARFLTDAIPRPAAASRARAR